MAEDKTIFLLSRLDFFEEETIMSLIPDFSSLVLTPLFIRFQAPNFKRQSLNVGHHD
jgi:hypothetical protein